jgi:regulator of cell morphogenesis and NO signaling
MMGREGKEVPPMNQLTTRSLGELVADVPARAAVFDRLGLDYCCHGQRPLAEACAEAGLDPTEVAAAVDAAGAPATPDRPVEPGALADHIEGTHHAYLHAELPELTALAAKVLAVHGERHPELGEVQRLVEELRADLEPHLLKEERVLFPAIRALVGGRRDFPFGTVRNPIRMMTAEHDRAGELLADLRTVTAGYATPADGCASYRSLYGRLEHLEADTHRHIHLENNVLFPAAVRIEAGEG